MILVEKNNKMMTSSMIRLLIALCLMVPVNVVAQGAQPAPVAPAPAPTPTNWNLAAPVRSIQGTYKMQTVRIDDHPPTLASIWEIGSSDFSVVAWPPKHCAAVHVLFIGSQFRGVGNFHVVENMTESILIKWMPPIGKVETSLDGGKSFDNYFNQRSTIHFNLQSSGNATYTAEMSESFSDQQKGFDGATKKSFQVNLQGRMALILTNSRFCFAHIIKAKNNGEFAQLFDAETFQGSLPKKAFTSFDHPEGIPSLFVPPKAKDTKTVDLLPVLQNPVFYAPDKLRQPPVCNGFVSASRNPLNHAIGAINVDSWTGAFNPVNFGTGNKREEHFSINIGAKCSWIRLWITDAKRNMDEYSKMKLDETIDIFFDQQFFVGPDSDEAKPLSGNSRQIDTISIRRHWDGAENGQSATQNIVQMSYGRAAGPALTYIEYFYMPSLHRKDFQVNLIKAQNCEANLVMGHDRARVQSANRPRPNGIIFKECTRQLLKNKNEDPLSKLDRDAYDALKKINM